MPMVAAVCWLAVLSTDRVADARLAVGPSLRREVESAGVRYPPARVYLRAFKRERLLEVWIANRSGPFRPLATYPIAGLSGGLGPKRKEGDLQVPEGYYRIDAFNPQSRYLLSMRIDYPNRSDRIRGRGKLGGDIYLHGGRASIGCLAMTDAVIQRLYLLLKDSPGKRPVHLFPARMDDAGYRALLRRHPEHRVLWAELKKGYDSFERTRGVPTVTVRKDGSYRVL
ncbi:MAG TPA: L,D-transpeptidase family protein [Fimbriimonas sp.]